MQTLRLKTFSLLVTAGIALASWEASAAILFDNGPVDASRATYNDTGPGYTVYDDFVLSSAATITELVYHIFTQNTAVYNQTIVSIHSGIVDVGGASGPLITSFNVVGSRAANGLVSPNPGVPNGFDITLSGLSLLLGPGTYTLGVSTDMAGSPFASIGSGPGSAQTIGTGLYQAGAGAGWREGAHMAFTVSGTPVPEPSTCLAGALLALVFGVQGFRTLRSRKTA